MFYQANQIKRLLNCSICNERFIDEIKCLPCGESICDDCSSKININESSREFKCQICNETHLMPEKGLPNNVRLNKLLKLDEEKVSRGEKIESFTKSLNELISDSQEFRQNIEQREESIKDYFRSLRSDIEINFESAVEHLIKLKESQLKQVDDNENKLLENNKSKREENEKLEQVWLGHIEEINKFNKQWLDFLEKASIEDEEVEKASQNLLELKNKLKEYQIDLQSSLFDDKHLKLIENKAFHDANDHFGELVYFDIKKKKSKNQFLFQFNKKKLSIQFNLFLYF